jgi:prepilin-type N-terminal cleavage/methylation domain-containing protein
MRRVLRFVVADQRGMSLAEILVACVIVAIGLVGLLSAVPTASYGIQEGRQLSTATFLANQRLEQVRNAPWTQCPTADTLGVSASASVAPAAGGTTTFPDESPMAAPYGDYTRTVRITDTQPADPCVAGVGGPNVGLRQVTVTVSYRPSTATGVAAAGTTKSAIVSMLMAQR